MRARAIALGVRVDDRNPVAVSVLDGIAVFVQFDHHVVRVDHVIVRHADGERHRHQGLGPAHHVLIVVLGIAARLKFVSTLPKSSQVI